MAYYIAFDARERMLVDVDMSHQVAPAEIKEVVSAYKDTGDVKKVQSAGLHIAGDRYVVIKADDRSLYGKKVHMSLPGRGYFFLLPRRHPFYNSLLHDVC